MQNFLQKRGKLIFIIFLITLAVCFAFGLYFMTNYKFVYICYAENGGALEITRVTQLKSAQLQNNYLFTYFQAVTGKNGQGPFHDGLHNDIVISSKEADADATLNSLMIIYNFQQAMTSFNNLIIIGTLVSFVAVALMYLFGNNNRVVYYKSNLYSGIVLPIVPLVFSVIFIIKSITLMGEFNANSDYFKVVSAMMDPNTKISDRLAYYKDWKAVSDVTANVNSTTFLVGIIIFAIVAIASLFMMFYAVYRYKACAKRRDEIIERANNKVVTA